MAQVPPTAGTCPVFPADHIWNTPVDNLPVHSLSASWIANIGPATGLHPDFGSGLYAGAPIGLPYVYVPGTQTKYPATFTYADESDPGPYAVPLNAPIEGGPSSTGDRHALSIDTTNCILYELYAAYPQTASWLAGSGAIFDLRNYILRPAGWTSADAAGLAVYPGLARYPEVAAGEIRHALRFTVSQTQKAYLWPARHYASDITDPNYPPMGARFRLHANFDITPYPADVQVILRCLKRYGMIIADNGSSWYVSGAPDSRWNNDTLHQLGGVHGSDFEAVDASSLIVNPNSGQARQTAILITTAPASVAVTVGASQQFTSHVTNTANTAVTWSVNGVTGGTPATGTINATGLYQAPTTPANVTVEATSAAQATARALSHVSVSNVAVTVTPARVLVPLSTTVQFTAAVTGTSNTSVIWRVNGVIGGDATYGTITTGGLYAAPTVLPAAPLLTISATSVASSVTGKAYAKLQ